MIQADNGGSDHCRIIIDILKIIIFKSIINQGTKIKQRRHFCNIFNDNFT